MSKALKACDVYGPMLMDSGQTIAILFFADDGRQLSAHLSWERADALAKSLVIAGEKAKQVRVTN